jgi:hypothetical protein
MTKKAVLCFKVVKYLDTPSYFDYMLNLPTVMGVDSVDATFLLWDDPDTGESQVLNKKDLTVEEYKKWLTYEVEKLTKMPKKVKTAFLIGQSHLL